MNISTVYNEHLLETENKINDTNNNKTLAQIIFDCSQRPTNVERTASVKWILNTFATDQTTKDLVKQWEHFIACNVHYIKNAYFYYYWNYVLI